MDVNTALWAESIEVESQQSPDNSRIVDILSRGNESEAPPSVQTVRNGKVANESDSVLPNVFSLEGEAGTNANRNDAHNAHTSASDMNTSPSGDDGESGSAPSSDTKNISLDELKYGFSSYHAIFTPVSITMILSALAVIFIQESEQARDANSQTVTGFYTVISTSDSSDSGIKKFGIGLINGLIIIGALTVATFLIVILYKYRCMKLLIGYMIACSAMLLGVLGKVLFETFIVRYGVIMDNVTFYILLVNFAAVGCISIFYAKGIPIVVTQAYLVFTSVILAWQLSFFDDLMAWILLVLLALYDLCAVLTPCGPLKALVNLMQKDNAPAMPGLLYEARLPDGVARPGRGRGNNNNTTNANETNGNNNLNGNAGENSQVSNIGGIANSKSGNGREGEVTRGSGQHRNSTMRSEQAVYQSERNTTRRNVDPERSSNRNSSSALVPGVLPFAIAKIYKLSISPENCPQFITEKYRPRRSTAESAAVEFSASELLTEVTVLYSPNGGRILVEEPEESGSSGRSWRHRNGSRIPRYIVQDANGGIKRVLVMNEEGKVFEERTGPRDEEGSDNKDEIQTIKLGLGDFIFYSVLVAKAALNSFTTFAACMLVILAGLGGTLVLLSVYHAALPALPISIFLGVIFFFTTKALIEPWVETVMSVPYYV
jgi:presenilin 1